MKMRGNPIMKRLDRYVGIPTVALLGLARRRAMPSQLKRIGLLRTAAVGDTLLLSGPLDDLRAAHPDAELLLITGETNAEAGALVAGSRARHLMVPVARPLEAVRLLRRERLDLLIDSGAWPRLDAAFTALSGARYRVGFRSRGQYRHFAYDKAVDHSPDVHELENFRGLIRSVGIEAGRPPKLRLDLPAVSPGIAGRFAVFHPWAGGYRAELREWPEEHWVELALRLAGEIQFVVISGTIAERSRSEQLAQALTDRGCGAVVLAGDATLAQLSALLGVSSLAVSVNTGIMHLAAIVGTPTVGLNGPTSTARWGAVGPRAVSIASTFSGCGFLNHGFEYTSRRTDCMLGISVDAVAQACTALLSSS